MLSCWVVPQIKNPNGEFVDSRLYKDLLEYTNNDRQRSNAIYEYIHSDQFISKFGDWINSKVKNTDINGEPLIGAIDIENISYSPSKVLSKPDLDYSLKIVNALQKLQRNKFEASKLQGWINDLQKQGVPKEQIDMFKDTVKEGMTKEEILSSILANYSYSVEVNTAIENEVGYTYRQRREFNGEDYDVLYEVLNQEGEVKFIVYTEEEAKRKTKDLYKPTHYYSSLSVPGGTNYTENEIKTPDITPSIKGHAQFSTDKGIGWFRSDEQVKLGTYKETKINNKQFEANVYNNYLRQGLTPEVAANRAAMDAMYNDGATDKTGVPTKTRRILELQSDLFQKGRDKEKLIGGEDNEDRIAYLESIINRSSAISYSDEGSPILTKTIEDELRELKEIKNKYQNQFLQLLNKDDNWVTFFIKSIIQDSAKKGYEKVLFPKGETAAKIEGHETIANELRKIDKEIDGANNIKINNIGDIIPNPNYDISLSQSGLSPELYYEKDGVYYWHDIEAGHFGEDTEKVISKTVYEKGKAGILEGEYFKRNPNGSRTVSVTKEIRDEQIEYKNNQIKKLEQRKSELKTQGIEKLKPIEAFYEIKVGNILEKLYGKDNVKTITDEYGNQWREIDLSKIETISKSVQLGNRTIQQLTTPLYLREIKPEEATTDIPKEPLTVEEQAMTANLSVMDEITKLKDKAIKSLETRYELNKLYKSVGIQELKKQEEFIKKIAELDADKAIVQYVRQAVQVTSKYYKLWEDTYAPKVEEARSNKQSIKDVLKPGLLYVWRDIVSTYDSIDDISNYLTKSGKLKQYPNLKAALLEAKANKDAIKSIYESLGSEILSEELAPFYNKVWKDFEVEVGQRYETLPQSEKSKFTKQQFIDSQKELNQESLRDKTVSLMEAEVTTASKDVGFLARWFNSPLETQDPIFAAIAKKFQYREFERLTTEIIPMRNSLVDALRKLEKMSSNKSNFKELYDAILEKDNKGNYTGKHIDRFGSWFWTEYERVRKEIEVNNELEDWEKVSEIKAWLNSNAPLRKNDFNDAKWAYIDALRENKELSDKDYDTLVENEGTKAFYNYYELEQQNKLSHEASLKLQEWHSNNVWEYRDPSSKWISKNQSYWKFKALNKRDDIVQFFDLIMDIKEQANKYLPVSMRLKHGDLPNILASNEERFKKGEYVSTLKNTFARQFNVLVDDIGRGNEPIEDEQGNIRHNVPIYYTGKTNKKDTEGNWIYDPNEQSYDIAGIFYKYFDMASSYSVRNQLKPEVEMASFFMRNREIKLLDKDGKPINKTKGVVTEGRFKTKRKGDNLIADQFDDWKDSIIYGITDVDFGSFNMFGLQVDKAKAIKLLQKYTGLNIMALNFKTGVSNVIMGEAQQIGESLAGQHMNVKSYHKGRMFYDKNLPGLIGDIGNRKPNNIITLLDEEFQITMESLDPKFKDNTVVKQLGKTSSLYFMLRSGDHWMKNRFFLGMLADKRAYNNKGEDIGSMLDQYSVKNGELILNKDVDLEKSKWTTTDKYNFTMRVQSILSGIHQEISPIGHAAAERHAILSLALLFRRFIAPGFARRYNKKAYIERMGDYTEGYYKTAGRYFPKLIKEIFTLKFVLMSEDWNKLTPMEKANIKRTLNDLMFFAIAFIMAGVFTKLGDDDDDEWVYEFMSYQMLRFQTEILFFTPKIDETMTILRSPFASMAVFENIVKLSGQLFDPTERYERGPWDDHLKVEKIAWDFVPVFRSFYQTRDIKEQKKFFDR